MKELSKEEKELLLKDLCARLPYGVKVQDELGRINKLTIGNADLVRLYYGDFSIYSEKQISLPLLRPMASMTEEERKEYNDIVKNIIDFIDCPKSDDVCFHIILIDWLNKHHFDYRGLIPIGLALEAKEDIYK